MAEREPLKILVVTAHPHDFTHCAATCGVHVEMGDVVSVVSVTGGGLTHNEKLHDELLKPEAERDRSIVEEQAADYMGAKEEELRRVCAIFGIEDVRIFGFRDKPFKNTPEVVRMLREVILEVRPDIIISQSPFLEGPNGMPRGGHDDHLETAYATAEAQQQASIPEFGCEEIPHTVAAVYYPGVYFQPDEIDFYVDVTAWTERRIEAEAAFASQGQSPEFARRRVEVNVGFYGWRAGTASAEGFVRAAPDVVSHIEVSSYALRRAREPRQNHMKRMAGELDS